MIGIGITTRNRPEVLRYSLSKFKENLPKDTRLVIVDDNSDRPQDAELIAKENGFEDFLWWNDTRKGIAKSKNKCLELLGDCDHYFLFDDDCYPIALDWADVCINTGLNHLIYARDKALNGQIKSTNTLNEMVYFVSGTGCFLYFTKEVVEKLGGFNEGYQLYGNEHNGHSYRIFNAGLTPAPYISIPKLEHYINCFDIDGVPADYGKEFCSVDAPTEKQKNVQNVYSNLALHMDKQIQYYQPLQERERIIKILGLQPKQFGGCVYFRQALPHISLGMMGFTYDYFDNIDLFTDEALQKFDAVFIQRGYMSSVEMFLRLKKLGLYIILDIDDWIEVELNHRLYKQFEEQKLLDKFKTIIPLCDLITCPTPIIEQELKVYHNNVHCIETGIDPMLPQFENNVQPHKKFTFGYMPGLCHKPDVELLKHPLRRISDFPNCKDKFEMILFGYAKETVFDEYAAILKSTKEVPLKIVPWVPVYQYTQGYNLIDCSLVPLQNDFFNNMKSELKLIEAGFMKKAVICSNVKPYTLIGKHEENCLMCDTIEDWTQNMKRLIHEPEFAKQLGENLYNTVKDKYNLFSLALKREKIYREFIK